MGIIQTLMGNNQIIYPATITDAVIHPQVAKPLTDMVQEYNVSNLWPTSGTNDGNTYSLGRAIYLLSKYLTLEQKINGIKVSFIPTNPTIATSKYEEWIWQCKDEFLKEDIDTFFRNEQLWTRCDIYKQNDRFREIEEVVFPLTLKLSLSTTTAGYTNQPQNVKLSWTAERRGNTVVPKRIAIRRNGESIFDVEPSAGSIDELINYRGATKYSVEIMYDDIVVLGNITYYQYPKIYYGYSSAEDITSKEIMEAMSGVISGSIGRTYTITLTGNGYAYFFVPDSLSISKATMNGFPYNLTKLGHTVTGSNGVVYRIWRTTNLQTKGVQNIVIS